METLQELKEELEPFKNTLVIDQIGSVVRLEDVIDGGDDYYWVYESRQGEILSSCVGIWIPLKGFIDDEQYEGLVRVWNFNHEKKAV